MLESGGLLIFTSSFVENTVGISQMMAYSASKAGAVGYTKSLASEYGVNTNRVNTLLPDGIGTPIAKEFDDFPEVIEFINSMRALKRGALPEEFAQSAL